MDLGLQGKVALVTACSGGLGAAVAHQLAKEGCRLVLFSRNEEKLKALSQELQTLYHSTVSVVSGDMTKEADLWDGSKDSMSTTLILFVLFPFFTSFSLISRK